VDIGATEYQYDLAVSGTGPAGIVAGGTGTYTLTVTNNGPDPVAGVTLTDVLPAGLLFESLTAPAGWTATTPAAGQSGTVTAADTATLAAGATARFTLMVQENPTTPAGTVLANSLSVSPVTDDRNPGNNKATLRSTVTAGAPAGVDIHGQPSDTVAGQPIRPAVWAAVVDAYGNTVTTSDPWVTLAIATGPAGATLGGTTTVRAVDGIAVFADLTLNEAGTYTLTATGGTLTPDFSNPFTVTPADVMGDFTVDRGKVHRAGRGVFEQTVTLANTSDHTLDGPLALVLEDLPPGVTLANASEAYQGSPYVNVLPIGVSLSPGRKVRVTLHFSIPDGDPSDLSYGIQALLGI
jgi:uncharacterized repeat protein (TIGR01451 family)